MRRTVVDAVLDLKEPYRSTLLLRYYEDLTAQQVAESQGLPLDTVKTRIKRGLDRLRMRLDRLHRGDRDKWCLALAPVAGLRLQASGETMAGVFLSTVGWLGFAYDAGTYGDAAVRKPLFVLLTILSLTGLVLYVVAIISRLTAVSRN